MKKSHAIRLEKFGPGDYDRLISWVDSAETLMQFAGPAFSYPLTKEQLDKSLSDERRYVFKVVKSIGNETIGHAEIYLGEEIAFLGKIFIGDEALRGAGIGQQIVEQLLDYVFNTLNREKVELNVFDWNARAIKCYEKAGFRTIPGRSAQRQVNGQNWTVLSMSIESEKWPRPGWIDVEC